MKSGDRVRQVKNGWSLPVRGAWIEINGNDIIKEVKMSLPVRGAWIEIDSGYGDYYNLCVAPRKGSVD